MSSLSRKRIFNSITFRILSLYFVLYVLSFLAFLAISFTVFYRNFDKEEDRIVFEELNEIAAKRDKGSFESLIKASNEEIGELGSSNLLIRLVEPGGPDLLLPNADSWEGFPLHGINRFRELDGTIAEILRHKDKALLKVGTMVLAGGQVIQVGYFSDAARELKAHFVHITEVIFLPILITGLGIGYLMARKSLAGISKVRQTAHEIYQGNLANRVDRSFNNDEIDQLSETFNLMLSRIQFLIGNMTDMIDNIAHDLRSPLTRMRGRTEIALLKERRPEEYQKLLGESLEDVDLLVSLVTTVLNIAEAESGTIILNKTRVDLRQFLASIYDFFTPLAEETGIRFHIGQIPEAFVHADAERIWMALSNLIDNAFKFTPPDGVIALQSGIEGDAVRITVRDTGPGIDASDQTSIFRRFYRLDKGRTRKGYGLGLSLVKAIVEIHGGRVEVASIPGQGSAFSVILPLARPGIEAGVGSEQPATC